ncbi:FMN-binding negative transcriptional regulator [Aquimarina sp. 2-A2]|uniref:FMN-binding negative transcriptional regulator n=1 Tax=Aquimarina sp. 2-A2 TaxID=3382644 RepID=UPI00387F19C8
MSHYPPAHHQDTVDTHSHQVVLEYPLATLVSVQDDMPMITHAPLILRDDKLVGHIDKNNPHCQVLKENKPITVIFQGPQTYISPSIYTTEQLPTWNYIIVHATGTVEEISDSNKIKESMVAMTSFLEAPHHPYQLKLDDPRMDRAVAYVHGFTINVSNWEGKFKLSQDKVPADIENAKQQLIKTNQQNIADFVEKIFSSHF